MAGERIYYIEDEQLARKFMTSLLTEQGYDITAFTSVDEAVRHMGGSPEAPKLVTNLPDAIITDNRTPGTLDGSDMLRAAKEAGILRIMLSADMKESQVIAAGGREAKLFHKPCNEDKLFDELRGMLDAKQRKR